jgi:conserved hypothetical protein
MRILLDTHVFVWMLADPGRIRADALEKLEDSSHALWVSSVSSYEIANKVRLRKWRLIHGDARNDKTSCRSPVVSSCE